MHRWQITISMQMLIEVKAGMGLSKHTVSIGPHPEKAADAKLGVVNVSGQGAGTQKVSAT